MKASESAEVTDEYAVSRLGRPVCGDFIPADHPGLTHLCGEVVVYCIRGTVFV